MSPRERILSRRARFIAAALAATGAASLTACGGQTDDPAPAQDAEVDTSPAVCLSDVGTPPDGTVDTGPTPCLTPTVDSGVDTGPTPCLDVAIDSGIDVGDDTGPSVCLKVAPDSGTD